MQVSCRFNQDASISQEGFGFGHVLAIDPKAATDPWTISHFVKLVQQSRRDYRHETPLSKGS